MRILISQPYFPSPNTGTGNVIIGLSKALIKAAAEIVVLVEGGEYFESKYEGIPYIQFKKQSFNPFGVSNQLLDYVLTNRDKVDLLILNGQYVPYNYNLGGFAKKINLPYVFMPHGIYDEISFNKSRLKKKIYFQLFEKKLIKNAIGIQMFTENQLTALEQIVTLQNRLCIPNGIDIFSKKKLHNRIRKKSEKVKIIFLGRKQVFVKGLDLLIKAFKNLENENVELTLQGGDIGETNQLIKLIDDLGLTNVVLKDKYLGNIPEYLSGFDILILPSRFDAFAMVVVEAMSIGLPVIVSKEVGASPHVEIASAGLLCDSNVESISATVSKMLMMEDEWFEMGQNGIQYISQNLTWDKVAELALEKYKTIIA